jgi:hypothetical protein
MEKRRKKNMKIKSKFLISMLLMLTMAASLILLPNTIAHTPAWEIPTWAYIAASPNPVGVGQQVIVAVWLNEAIPGSLMTNDIRFHDFKLVITAPNGENQTVTWDVVWDTVSSAYTTFIPEQIGTYKLVFSYPGQTYTWSGEYQNDVYLPSTSKVLNLIVQEEQLPPAITSFPLPTEYWARPIEGQNTPWGTIASNWLSMPYIWGGSYGYYQPNGIGPESAHILWTKVVNDGGVVGGSYLDVEGENFYSGMAYNARFADPIIMNGRLFYQLPYGNAAGGGGYQAVDLLTGEELWWANTTGIGVPSFGYYLDYHDPNQHGVIPDGWLFTNNFARAYYPTTGITTTLSITGVPSGTELVGPSGEILRLQLNSANKWLAQWNSSKVFTTQTSGSINAGLASRYDWNVSIPNLGSGTWSIWREPIFDDILLLTQGDFGSVGEWEGANVTAISLKPASRGHILWTNHYAAAPNNMTRTLQLVDSVNRVFVLSEKETFKNYGYSLDTGNYLWETSLPENGTDHAFWTMSNMRDHVQTAYGKLYSARYGGLVYCWDTKDGKLLWTYGNGGVGNNTNPGLQSAWNYWPTWIFAIADGKLYTLNGEHSPNTPLYKGAKTRCIDANTGQEIWTMTGSGGYPGRTGAALADGVFTYFNLYDSQIYAIGKGPSAITVDTPKTAISKDSSLVISGTITDLSAGTKQHQQAARFPNGVPCVSDASQGEWMEYVYMQKPRPDNITGVPIRFSVLDANNNFRPIGNATSDIDGFFSLNWTPDIEGKYTIYASFDGSASYWPSHAVAAFAVDPTAPTTEPLEMPPQSMADLYFVPMSIGIILAVIVVGVLLAFLLLRKRP